MTNRRTYTWIVAAAAVTFALAAPASAKPGKLDTSFGGTGIVVTPHLPFTIDAAEAVLVQDDGKIVVIGSRENEDTGEFSSLVLRYLDNGSPDPGFGGGDGAVVVPMGGPSQAHDGALLPDGRIVVAGQVDLDPTEIDFDMAAAVLTEAGDPDVTFGGGDGVGAIHVSEGLDLAFGVAVDAQDRIILAGMLNRDGGRFGVGRLDVSGQPDTSFSGDGWRPVNFKGGGRALDVAVAANGRIVVVGGVENAFALARLMPDGSMDERFSRDGKTTASGGPITPGYANGVILRSDGRIVVAGGSQDFVVARFMPKGTLDRTFSRDGFATANFRLEDVAYEVLRAPAGRIVVVGASEDGAMGPVFARFKSNGKLDTTFSRDGKVIRSDDVFGQAGALDPSGRLLVSGGGQMNTARYLMS